MFSRLSVGVFLALRLASAADSRPLEEYKVKAAFLYNFARFVEWPAAAFLGLDDPLTICVLGDDPFGRTLDEIVAGKKLDSHAFAVRRISDARNVAGCRILFVSSSERKRVLASIAAASEQGLLTVGESCNPTAEGMIINFTVEDGKVRFEINRDAAERSNIRLSSRLLSLASTLKK